VPHTQRPAVWRLNPVFDLLGFTIGVNRPGVPPTERQEHGDFDLTQVVYDKPGSWTTMLATQPPCQLMEVVCSSELFEYSVADT
jgi:hypothetical protein